MRTHIQELGRNGATVDDVRATMVLDLRVQPGGMRAAQSLIDFGKQFGVGVVIEEFK